MLCIEMYGKHMFLIYILRLTPPPEASSSKKAELPGGLLVLLHCRAPPDFASVTPVLFWNFYAVFIKVIYIANNRQIEVGYGIHA